MVENVRRENLGHLKKCMPYKSYFRLNIKSHVVPGKNMAKDAQKKFPVLQKQTWILIKAKVYNLIVKDRKKK